METVEDQTISRAVVVVDGKFFIRCKIIECRIIYCGGDFGWRDTQFQDCQIQFDGVAGRVVKFLQNFGLLSGGAVQQPPNPPLNTSTVN